MIPKKTSRIFIIVGMAVFFTVLTGFINQDDDPILVKIVTRLNEWLSTYPTEKVYLQLDKPYYAAGDNIWFKAYITGNNRNQLSALSGVLNVELIDSRDSVRQHIKLPLLNGVAHGDFALPDTLSAGNYRIIAYTNWMRNAGDEYYFDKTITIGSRAASLANTKTLSYKPDAGLFNVQFFPESGNLVNGLRSKVAVKVMGSNGLGADATGIIVDNKNDTISTFTTRHLGMGIFALTPQNGKTYKALVNYANRSKGVINLPAALNSGYVLTFNNTDAEYISIKVSISADMPDAGKFYIVAQSGGQTSFIANNKSNGNVFSINVPKNKFPSGIVQFTLFSSAGDPLNERVAFIQHPEDLLKLNVTSGNSTAHTSEKHKIEINATNSNDKPIQGTFSVAVINDDKVPDNQTEYSTILSHLLLTSDLRGYIENPAYYFNNPDETTQANLDILMLTQGYRRFEWKPLLTGNIAIPKYNVENSIEVSGKVISNYGNKPVANAKVILLSRGGGLFYTDTTTDQYGRFAFKNLAISDSTRFTIQARTPKDGTYVTIVLDKDKYQRTESLSKKLMPNNSVQNLTDYLAFNKALYDQEIINGVGNHSVLLNEVNIRQKIDYSSNIAGAGNADQVITTNMMDKYGLSSLENYLRIVVSGVRFNGGIAYSTRGRTTLNAYQPPMLVLVNGVESPTGIADIMTSDVGSIEILKGANSAAIYGSRAMNGVIIINLKNGRDALKNLPSNFSTDIIKFKPNGYYSARVFYSPQYDDPKTNKTLADLRSTIYWNPDIITDSKGHASFEYYNAGTPGTYRVVIEGMDADGHLGHEVYRYKVQ